ncbi:DUF3025 domain-containing protein [Sulfurirhabdus autotrophica]|nr:DUF3025 domain-containing protein [Sulfurirhabdus autotrophica]
MKQIWDPQFLSRSPMFEPLYAIASSFMKHTTWPHLQDYQQLLHTTEKAISNQNGQPIQFVPQGQKPLQFSEKYEPRIFLTGEVQTRTHNWHDLFNSLVWLAFPKAKAIINARHYAAFRLRNGTEASENNRPKAQDAITLFDESGVVVAYSDENLANLLKDFQWKTLFWEQRSAIPSGMKLFLFGHSLYEKALHPYTGMTGKGLLVKVDKLFFDKPVTEQVIELDGKIAAILSDESKLTAPQALSPVPLLGMPGWSIENESEKYYDNSDYFRPGRLNNSSQRA